MFHDIFQEKKTKVSNKPKPKIIADIHEKNSLILSELKYCNEINLEISHLEIADFIIGEIAIERKTINDFVSSMISKRLSEQLNQMQKYNKKLLILEGKFEEITHSKINPKAIKGCILSIITNHNIPIIFTNNPKDSASYLILLAKQQLKPKLESTLHSRIPKTTEEQKQYILESFPNIGPAKAKSLLNKFQSLNKIFNSNEEDLKDILKNQSKDFKDLLEK